jgi:ribosomal protein L9
MAIRKEKHQAQSQDLVKKLKALEGKLVTIQVKTNEKGRMYAAVEPKELVKAIKKQFGVFVPVTIIPTKQPKDLGVHPAEISLQNTTIKFNLELVNA